MDKTILKQPLWVIQRMVSLMWLACAKFILFRNFGAKHFEYVVAILIPIHFHEIYIGSSSPQTTDNCVPKFTLALWRELNFVESFYGEFDISREILLILEKPYLGQGYVTNYAVLVAKIDLF